MVHREGNYKGRKYILEKFENIDEFLKEIEGRPIAKDWKGTRTAEKLRGKKDYDDQKFRNVKNYQEAREQFVNGTKAKAEMLKAFQTEVDPHQRQAVNAPCGCAPIVAHALMGVPDAMIDIRRKRIPKATKFIIDMTVHCGVRCGDIIEAGKQIIAAVAKLESEGISTEITCSVDSRVQGMLVGMGITVKNAGQGFSAARVSFPMSSPAFLRVFSFMQMSSLEGVPYDSGYGSAIAYSTYGKELEDYYRTMYGDGVYISLANVIKGGQYEIDNAISKWRKGR